MSKIDGLHPVVEIFPRMPAEEFADLVADIAEHGQKVPVLVTEGLILDGRHRWEACQELGIECDAVEWDGGGAEVDTVISLNLKRRHLDAGQVAAVAVEAEPFYAAEAKEDQGTRTDLGKPYPKNGVKLQRQERTAAGRAAAAVGAGRSYVEQAKQIKKRDPGAFEQIKRGEKKISQVKREQRQAEHKARPAVRGRFRVLYADPPWKYGSSSPGLDYYGPAERHYEALSIEELCELRFDDGRRVEELAEDHSVLFLWVTSPMLEDSFKVIRAWGFKYKTSFIWDKVRHNFGHYNSVRHEFLLVCTRGSCTPEMDELKLPDSVVELERTKEHSEKPGVFREIIDEMYPKGERLELFSRKEVAGWRGWGSMPSTEHAKLDKGKRSSGM